MEPRPTAEVTDMEIRSNPFDRSSLPPADITRPNREAIDKSLPEFPPEKPVEEGVETNDAKRALKLRIQNARQDGRERRIANARADNLERRVANARGEAKAKRIENARTEAGKGSPDAVELSRASEIVADAARPTGASRDAERAGRVQDLKADYVAGKLNTDELIARAAFRMLSGE
ncbi:MAG TPA: hypothetical protein VMS76_04435 [Planctomycetota bacterium]|nr:hypothetical protein [Planctomycetota bacterium]